MKEEINRIKKINFIENAILEVANEFNDVTTSDLQGIALAKANDILKVIEG